MLFYLSGRWLTLDHKNYQKLKNSELKMKIIFIVSVLTFILYGCKENPSGPITSTQYELWRSYNIHDYTYDQIRNCFCINGNEKMKVTIRADTVFSVIKISDLSTIPYPVSKQYLTIDSLFGIINNSSGDSLVVSYDPQYGYPSLLDINPQLHPVDGGVMYLTSNLQTNYK